jgi:tetratricopeptide (TPR) repeat protein
MKTPNLILFVAILGVQAAAFGQGGKPGGSQPSSTPQPTGTTTGSTVNQDYSNLLKSGRVGDFLAGDVKIANGSLPWDAIPITVTCAGTISFTTHADAKGNFVIAPAEPKGSTNIRTDAKPSVAQFVGCKIAAALSGYESSGVTVADRNLLDSPNVGTITLRQDEGAKGSAFSSTSAAAPKDAAKAFEKARTDRLENKPDRAEKDLQKAVQVYPQFAEAWYQLGRVQEVLKSPEAKNSFAKAVAADPQFVLPHERLAILAAQTANWQEVVNETSRALELDPRGNVQVWYFNGLGNAQLQKMEVAEVSAKKALAMDPLHEQPNTEQLLAVILVGRRDFAGALQHLKSCVTYLPAGPNLELVKQQIAQIEPMVPAAK